MVALRILAGETEAERLRDRECEAREVSDLFVVKKRGQVVLLIPN
jgi:hypothetical protein